LEKPLVIDSSWQQKTISDVLTISLPDSALFNKESSLNATFAEGRFGLYGVDFFDTVVVYIENEKDFLNALKGYIGGKLGTTELRSFDLMVRDTSIGNSNGFFMTGYTNDSLERYKFPFCYVTLANSNFYWFYSLQHTPDITDETRQFFHSIEFDKEKLQEAGYRLPAMRFRKKAK